MSIRHMRIFAALGLSALMLLVVACQTTGTVSDRPNNVPAADTVKDEMEEGKSAAKRKDWVAAIRHFRAAAGLKYFGLGMEKRPYARDIPPEILFNLGLASDNAGGRELQTIAYYRAYLALVPRARNGAAIRKRFAPLLAKSREQAKNLLGLLERAAREFPPGDFTRNSGLNQFAGAWAFMGDLNAGERIAKEISKKAGYSSASDYTLKEMAEGRLRAGDYEGAERLIRRHTGDVYKASVLGKIAEKLARDGAIDAALTVLKRTERDFPKEYYWREMGDGYDAVIKWLVRHDRHDQARALIPDLLRMGRHMKSRYFFHNEMVKHWLDLAEVKKAWSVAREVPAGNSYRNANFSNLAQGLAKMGRMDEAWKAISETASNYDWRSSVEKHIKKIETLLAERVEEKGRLQKAKEEKLKAETPKAQAAARKSITQVKKSLTDIEFKLSESDYRGPVRMGSAYANEAFKERFFSLGEIEADDWLGFRVTAQLQWFVSDSSPEFLNFISKKDEKFTVTRVGEAVNRVLAALAKYEHLDKKWEKRKRKAVQGRPRS